MVDRSADAPVDLTQLRTFLAVYRAGSMTAGARQAGYSQPAVTQQLQGLERHLGRPLFERLPRGVAPTAAAHDLAARVSGPLDDLSAVVDTGRPNVPRAPEPPVLLGGPADFLAAKGIPALAPLIADGVRLDVRTGLTDDLLGDLRAGKLDLVVSTVRPRGRTLIAEALCDETFGLVAAPEIAERVDRSRLVAEGPAALSGLALLSYAADLPILRRYWRHVFGIRLDARAALVVDDLRAVLAAVCAGAGISVLPSYLYEAELAAGLIVELIDTEDPPINTAFLARRHGSTGGGHVDLVARHLLDEARRW
ncbi:LysR family transcriptional regulator [Nocardia sp. NPDC059180]|uniref:LysR family transcriptional regulator n=1 Tax=Nocardia sp. NPDC059180 TaxID=3346761 RepID=UPI00369AED58